MTERHEMFVSALPKAMWSAAREAAEALERASSVTVATHIDADGISAGAIATKALERARIKNDVMFFKKLDEDAIGALRDRGSDIIWFTDLGSGSVSKLEGFRAVITDHHVPDTSTRECARGQSRLSDFSSVIQVNPQLNGLSGANDLSGAGATLVVAVALGRSNIDLAHLAIVGSVGDLQDQKTRRLEGLNHDIVELARAEGLVDASDDLRLFGRETRPVHKMLEYSSDPFLPGITGNEQAAISFLLSLGIELKEEDAWRTWAMLSLEERMTAIDALRDLLRERGRRPESITRLTGEVYVLVGEAPGSMVRDAKEYATLLNACGRHGKAEVGLRICMGDRGAKMAEGAELLRDHRSALSQGLSLAKEIGVVRLKNIQYFDSESEIEDTIVGTVAGMLLGDAGSDRSAPMVAFADSTEYSDEPKAKASARGTQDLVSRGMDLSAAMRKAAETVGGVGGGHNIAAGATVPASKKREFLIELDEIVGEQLSLSKRRAG